MGHAQRHPQPVGQSPDRGGQAGRVQAAGVGDDAHPVLVSQAQTFLELGQESLGIAAFGALHPVSTQDEHGQFGEVVAGQVIQLAAGEHLSHGG